jgi:hypothetical protein
MNAAKQENIKQDNTSPPRSFQKQKKDNKEDGTFLHSYLIILFINSIFIFCLILLAVYY